METSNTISFTPAIHFKYFSIISILFSSTWLTSNIAAVKLVSINGIALTGGFLIFPFTTLFSNIIIEVYGYKNARQAIWSGLILNLSFIFFINVVNLLPPHSAWKLNEQFANILVVETRIVFASIISFLISDFLNSYLMAKLKIKTLGKSLIRRLLICSSISISLDVIGFLLLAFGGIMPAILLIKLMLAAYLKKFSCQIILLPLIWFLIKQLKLREKIDIYDVKTKFNPFSLENTYDLNSIASLNSHSQKINNFPSKLSHENTF